MKVNERVVINAFYALGAAGMHQAGPVLHRNRLASLHFRQRGIFNTKHISCGLVAAQLLNDLFNVQHDYILYTQNVRSSNIINVVASVNA